MLLLCRCHCKSLLLIIMKKKIKLPLCSTFYILHCKGLLLSFPFWKRRFTQRAIIITSEVVFDIITPVKDKQTSITGTSAFMSIILFSSSKILLPPKVRFSRTFKFIKNIFNVYYLIIDFSIYFTIIIH